MTKAARAVEVKPRPALRLIKTDDLSREQWLDVRRGGIGSSDAAAAVGLNPYKSQLELWMEKTGRQPPLPQSEVEDEESPMYWGTLLEPIVASHYAKRTGHRVRRIKAVLQHPDHAFMLANIDREVVGQSDVQILECKTAGINGARLWKDGVPEYVQVQVMHQLAVTGKQAADVAVLLGGQRLEIHRIERDEAMIANLIKLEAKFWAMVESDTPPDPDGSDSAAQALLQLYPYHDEELADFQSDMEMEACYSDLLGVRQQMEQLDTLENQLRQRIQQRMGTAGRALFSAGEVTWRKTKNATILDTARLLRDQPTLLTDYGITRTGSRRFVVNSR